MFSINKSILINRPQQEVFDYAANPANAHEWQSQFVSVEWRSEGPHRVGSTLRSVSRFLGREVETSSQITVWDPPNQHGFKTIGGPLQAEGGMNFATEGDGTKVTLSGQIEAGGLFKLAEGVVRKQLESQFEANLEALKMKLESDSA